MTEEAFAACLANLLNADADIDDAFDESIRHVVPYDEAGILTRNAGVVVMLEDGSEYQITVVRSCGPHR